MCKGKSHGFCGLCVRIAGTFRRHLISCHSISIPDAFLNHLKYLTTKKLCRQDSKKLLNKMKSRYQIKRIVNPKPDSSLQSSKNENFNVWQQVNDPQEEHCRNLNEYSIKQSKKPINKLLINTSVNKNLPKRNQTKDKSYSVRVRIVPSNKESLSEIERSQQELVQQRLSRLLKSRKIALKTGDKSTTLSDKNLEVKVAPQNEFECKRCSVILFNREELYSHIKTLHGRNLIDRPIVMTEPDPDRRAAAGVSSKSTVCNLCGENFPTVAQMSRHKRKHLDSMPWIPSKLCEDCGERFLTRTSLLDHIERKHGELLQCNECPKKIRGKKALRIHIAKSHRNEPQICPVCGVTIRNKSYFKYHMTLHSGEKKFKCDECDKAFTLKQALRSHQQFQHTKTWYRCEICCKPFQTMAKLNLHVKGSHEQATRYSCDVCQKQFYQKYMMKNHRRTHFSRTRNKILRNAPACGVQPRKSDVSDSEEPAQHIELVTHTSGDVESPHFSEDDQEIQEIMLNSEQAAVPDACRAKAQVRYRKVIVVRGFAKLVN